MNDKDPKGADQIDALSDEQTIKNELGIKEKPSKRNGKMIIIVGVAVALLLIVIMLNPLKKATNSKSQNERTGSSYSLEEAKDANQKLLAQMGKNKQIVINQLASEATQPKPPIHSVQDQHTNTMHDKEMQARMNMPMQMRFSVQQQNRQLAKTEAKTATSGLAGGNGAAFANSQSVSFSQVKAEKVAHPEYTIVQGEMLHAVLTTAIDNELAGMISATITRSVYSYNDERILLPTGSRLVGQFRSGGGNAASSRIFVIWNRVITPDGVSVMINSISTDTLGRSGQGADYIDTHFFKMFGTAAIISLIGASASVGSGGNAMYPSTEDQYRQAITRSFGQTSNAVLTKNINLEPTLYVEQGAQINVFVAHDLDFYDVLEAR